ncbi:WD40 repeat domain-containing protein [Sphaerisporangium flaviroseum]|uniref:WD40 repeat domain-containing protein n=1 Tax=Sphaerisporangium flaviroseum TaxID=509199 RepID=A0ABP7I3U1_9ACTN
MVGVARVLIAFGLVVISPVAASAAAAPGTGGTVHGVAGAGGEGKGASGAKERLLFRFKDSRISESSGLAVSPTHKDVVYTHNDSGSGPQFFAVGTDGRTLAAFTLAGAAARDWEAMAASVDPATGAGVLWFADIGDNLNGAWPDYSIYKVTEPKTMRDATIQATRYRFKYKDGGRNAEGIMVNPVTGRLYVISKEFAGSIYAAPAKLRTDKVNVLRRVGPAPIMSTDAAYAPDGSSFVIRTYLSASLYRAPGELISRLSMPSLQQAESITYTRDGRSLLTGTEGANSPVYEVPLPAAAVARPAAKPPATPSRASVAPSRVAGVPDASSDAGGGDDSGVPAGVIALWLGVALGATGIIAVIARRVS